MTTGMAAFITLLLLLALAWQPAFADPLAGRYSGQLHAEEYRLSIQPAAGGLYEGELRVADTRVGLVARRFGDRVMGQLGSPDDYIGFVITLQGNLLRLEDEDGEVILFHRAGEPEAGSKQPGANAAPVPREVYVNRVPLDQQTLQALELQNGLPIADGRYWYDAHSGAWGVEGGPTAGLVLPGLPLPVPIPADISGRGTGIFINGREIHALDQQALYQLFGVAYQGNFWMDAQGYLGRVGGPAIANVLQAAPAAQSGGDAVTQGYDSAAGARGSVGSGMYSGRSATAKSVFWYPGM
jgi:hypothetical protein